MKTIIKLLSLVVVPFIFQSCFTLSSHQTAKTLGKHNASIQFINGYVGVPYNEKDPNNESLSGYSFPQLNAYYGVGDRLDLGLSLGFTRKGLSSKYRILDFQDSKFNVAIGLNGYIGTSDDVSEETGFSNIELPLYFSYDIVKPLTIYANPMLTKYKQDQPYNPEGSYFLKSGYHKGITSGLMYTVPGKHLDILLSSEIAWFSPLRSNKYMFFTTLGVGFKVKTGWFSKD